MSTRTRILCVDDDQRVLDALALHLRRRYDTTTMTSGRAGLEDIARNGPPAVVVSDMQMPEMDGATFLGLVRSAHPDTVRILLTGMQDISAAIAAINEGQIFRFLTKPCATTTFINAVEAAVVHHELVTSQRVLLEQTLHGSIEALVELLALTNPESFGWTMRVKHLVSDLALELGVEDRWQVEVAAMLSQLAYITLPPDVADKVHRDLPLTAEETAAVARVPETTQRLLSHIPRIDAVRAILVHSMAARPVMARTGEHPSASVHRCAQILGIATRFDRLVANGNSAAMAIGTLRAREPDADPEIFDALTRLRGGDAATADVREVPLAAIEIGMVLADELRTSNGTLLVPRGYKATGSFVEHCRNMRRGTVSEPVRVIVPPTLASAPLS